MNQENYDLLLKEDSFNQSYLDKFNLDNFDLPGISAIIPTYNRAPHPVEEDSNPLGWCIESLLAQKGKGLNEIIVIDDNSTDYTQEVIKDFSNKSNIPINYLKNSKNLGSSVSRNIGVEKSKNNLVMFLDDDCIMSRYMFFGANYILNNSEDNVAALHLPIYHRRTMPRAISKKNIGILNLEEGIMDGNYDGFPIEYLENLEDSFMDEKLKIVKPFEMKNLGGIFLTKKNLFQEIGGFPEFLTWKNSYREETNVALSFSDKGYKILFTPDPKFHCIHLKYGAAGTNQSEELEPKLRRLIEHSNMSLKNTGNRVDPEEWFFDLLISTYVTLGRKNRMSAEKYLSEKYISFVENNELGVSGVGTKINDFEKRVEIFNRAKTEGNKLINLEAI